jgi:hypothetical protein
LGAIAVVGIAVLLVLVLVLVLVLLSRPPVWVYLQDRGPVLVLYIT